MTTAYIIDTFRAPESVKLFLDDLLDIYNSATRQFFIHVLFGTLNSFSKKEEGWVPVPAALVRREWGRQDVQWGLLAEDGLLEIKVLSHIEKADGLFIEQTYSKLSGLCRCYRVTTDTLERILSSYPKKTEEFISGAYFNLMTGKRMIKYRRHELTDDHDSPIPELVRNSMESIKRCVINGISS